MQKLEWSQKINVSLLPKQLIKNSVNMNEIYSITKQYHEKNCVDIWVVRLNVKVDSDAFSTLRGFARDMRGYYSTFKGVNGFVFEDEDTAEEFGDKLDNYLVVVDDWDSKKESLEPDECEVDDKTPCSLNEDELPNTIEEISLNNFYKKLKLLINEKGASVLFDANYKTVEALKSVEAFKELPPSIEFILRTIIAKKYGQQLLAIGKWNKKCRELIDCIALETGFQINLVQMVLTSIAKALDWKNVSCEFVQDIQFIPMQGAIDRPAPQASEEVWEDYLSQQIVWKTDFNKRQIDAKASVSVCKTTKTINIYVALESHYINNITLYATIYDVYGNIKDSDKIFDVHGMKGYRIRGKHFWLKCSITRIEKIVISEEFEDEDEYEYE